jgi:PAS domain-containing protein
MRSRAPIYGLILTLAASHAAPAAPQAPEVIDRIVAAINHTYIITASDVRRERAVMRALGEDEKSDREILEDLIGWRLLEEQMAQFPGIDVSDEELAALVRQVVNPLAAAIDEVRVAVRQRKRRANYVNRRFGQFIHVTEEEKRKYYQDVFVPRARQDGLDPIPDYDASADRIQAMVFIEKSSQEVLNALAALRARSDVEIFQ